MVINRSHGRRREEEEEEKRRKRIRDVSHALSTSFLGQGFVVPVSEKGKKSPPYCHFSAHTALPPRKTDGDTWNPGCFCAAVSCSEKKGFLWICGKLAGLQIFPSDLANLASEA